MIILSTQHSFNSGNCYIITLSFGNSLFSLSYLYEDCDWSKDEQLTPAQPITVAAENSDSSLAVLLN